MYRVLAGVGTSMMLIVGTAMAQTAAPAPAAPPTTVAACLAMLNEIGPKVAAAKLPASELAALRAKGGAMAGYCNQSKFKEAAETHAQMASTLAAKK